MPRVSPRITQRLALTGIWGTGVVTVLILLVIIAYVLIKGAADVDWAFLSTPPKGGTSGEGGISTVIVCTFYLIGLTMAVAVPLGVGAAIYLAEYASDNHVTRSIRYGTEVLAGVPSIVFGLFGFALFVTALHFRFSILSGSLTLACLLLPALIRTSEEALRAVPRSQREAALALGATRWQTVWRVLLPAALPGIVTGIILSIGRAVGETACLFVTMGGSAALPTSLLSGGRSLSMHLLALVMDTNAFGKALATGVVLIVVIMVINAVTNWVSRRFRARMSGGA